MKRLAVILFSLLVATLIANAEEIKIETKTDSLSYAIGREMGKSIFRDSIIINKEFFVAGFEDALDGNPSRVDTNKLHELLYTLQMELNEKYQKLQQEQREKELAEKLIQGENNIKAAEDFLKENAKKESVTETPTGLQFEVLMEGTGAMPSDTSKISFHYIGSFLDGRQFDNSFESGQPLDIKINNLVPGMQEGIRFMKEGGRRKFYIHPKIGYGEQGIQNLIGPNEMIIFEVELLKVLD